LTASGSWRTGAPLNRTRRAEVGSSLALLALECKNTRGPVAWGSQRSGRGILARRSNDPILRLCRPVDAATAADRADQSKPGPWHSEIGGQATVPNHSIEHLVRLRRGTGIARRGGRTAARRPGLLVEWA